LIAVDANLFLGAVLQSLLARVDPHQVARLGIKLPTPTPYYGRTDTTFKDIATTSSTTVSPSVTGTETKARLEPTDSASYNDQHWTPLRSGANAWILSVQYGVRVLCPEPRTGSASIAWQKKGVKGEGCRKNERNKRQT
jgi:hypothetical protein